MSSNLEELAKPRGEYRQYLPDLGLERFQAMRNQDAHEYAHDFKTLRQPPWLHALYMHWLELLQEPFKGVTADGMLPGQLMDIQLSVAQEMSSRVYLRCKTKGSQFSKSSTQQRACCPF